MRRKAATTTLPPFGPVSELASMVSIPGSIRVVAKIAGVSHGESNVTYIPYLRPTFDAQHAGNNLADLICGDRSTADSRR
jgi:hypothetical protein